MINWNLETTGDYAALFPGLFKLKNETLCTKVRGYVGVPLAMSEEDHNLLHSKLTDSSKENPHSFCFTLIHKDAANTDSEIVGMIGTGSAWDAALLNLLPDNVRGIDTVIKNDCNQSYTYQIQGHDAIYIGEGDFHQEKYGHMEVSVELNPHNHPDFYTTPGHCQYSMVRFLSMCAFIRISVCLVYRVLLFEVCVRAYLFFSRLS